MQKQTIFFPFRLPGQNKSLGGAMQSRGRSNAYNQSKKRIEGHLVALIKQAALRPVKAVCIEFLWKEPNRRRDPDNIIADKKYILDALVTADILPGDGWEQIKGLADDWKLDMDNPGVEVSLTPSYPTCLEE